MFGELLTAMLTPFDNNGVINTPVISKLSKKLIKDGNDGIVLAGTTGESPNLSYGDTMFAFWELAASQRQFIIILSYSIISWLPSTPS